MARTGLRATRPASPWAFSARSCTRASAWARSSTSRTSQYASRACAPPACPWALAPRRIYDATSGVLSRDGLTPNITAATIAAVTVSTLASPAPRQKCALRRGPFARGRSLKCTHGPFAGVLPEREPVPQHAPRARVYMAGRRGEGGRRRSVAPRLGRARCTSAWLQRRRAGLC